MGTSPVDRHQVSPNATASSLASEPPYPMTTRLVMMRFLAGFWGWCFWGRWGVGLDVGQVGGVAVVVPQPGVRVPVQQVDHDPDGKPYDEPDLGRQRQAQGQVDAEEDADRAPDVGNWHLERPRHVGPGPAQDHDPSG